MRATRHPAPVTRDPVPMQIVTPRRHRFRRSGPGVALTPDERDQLRVIFGGHVRIAGSTLPIGALEIAEGAALSPRDDLTTLAHENPAAYLAALRNLAARARRMFIWSLVISVVLALCYPAAWVAVILLFDSTKDVGQGFYLVWFWMLLFPFFVVSLVFTAIAWARRNSASKTAAAASAGMAAQRPAY